MTSVASERGADLRKPLGRLDASGVGRRGDASLWAIVLAGGQGVRLRPLTRQVCGDDRPKQYASLIGSRSLLRQTLDRAARLIPPELTVVVTLAGHARYLAADLAGAPPPHVLAQPQDRGTAAGVLFPAHWIRARAPRATVAVFPSDHFILEEAAFMAYVAGVAAFVMRHPGWIALLGVQPTEPETEYGWIEPGPRVGWTDRGPLYQARRFHEKPSAELAQDLFTSGALWNTFVVIAGLDALIRVGQECLPALHERLARLAAFVGTTHEAWAIRQAYTHAPTANFSRAVLAQGPRWLAVAKVPAVTWCDLGTPERVVRTCRHLGVTPPWLAALQPTA